MYPQAFMQKEERTKCPLAMVLWTDQWVSEFVTYMTHPKEPCGACAEPSDTIVNLFQSMTEMKCCVLGGKV